MTSFFKSFSLISLLLTQDPAKAMVDADSEGSTQPVVKQLMERGYFVHAMRQDLFAPEYDMTLRAGAVVPRTETKLNSTPLQAMLGSQNPEQALKSLLETATRTTTCIFDPDQLRPCLYFTLNCLVESHAALDLSQYTSVAFIPAQALLPYVVNFSVTDTAVWRLEINLRKTPGALLMIPQSRQVPEGFAMGETELIRYDGNMTSAVNALLDERTAVRVTLTSAPTDRESLLDRATLQGVELADPKPFSDILSNPAISFGHDGSSKRAGIGTCIFILHKLVTDFNRIWKIGIRQQKELAKPPEYLGKYRIEPFVALGKVVRDELERLLALHENPDMAASYAALEKSKIGRALTNLENLVRHHQDPKRVENWRKRPYSSEVALRLADFPFTVAQKVLEDEGVAPIREYTEVMYWFHRHNNQFYGVLPSDDMDVLANLQRSAAQLRAKINQSGFTWPYAQYLNSVLAPTVAGKNLKGFAAHYLKALKAIGCTLPKSGRVSAKTLDQDCQVLITQTLADNGIIVPGATLKKGFSHVPRLVSPNNMIDSY